MTLSSRAETAIGASGRYPGIPTGAHDSSAAASRRLRGLVSLLALLAVLGGPPTALALTVGWPLPTALPTPAGMHRALTAPLADTTLLRALACVAWLAWAHVAACVLAEARAQLGGRPRPRLPFGGPAQLLAARLVAAALVLLPTTPQLATGPVPLTRAVAVAPLAGPLPATRVVAAEAAAAVPPVAAALALERAPATPVDGTAAPSWQPGPEPATPAAEGPAGKVVVVQPPQGRWHDTLWDIAARHLGDPLRYPEIYQLNRGRLQPDGNRLTRESLIQPGWVLLLPADAIDAQTLPPPPMQAPPAPDPVPAPGVQATAPPPAATGAPGGSAAYAAPAQPSHMEPGEPSPTSQLRPAAGAPASPTTRSPWTGPSAPAPTPAGHHGLPAVVPAGLGLGLGSLALLAALERARRAAGRRRRPGRRPAPLPPRLQPVDSDVRAEARRSAQDATAVQRAVRLATRLAAARGTPLPLVAVLQLPDGAVELRLAVDALAPPPAPAPFIDIEGGWRLPAAAADYLVAAADGDDPRPALAPVGQLADATCLVDLETAGLVGVAGDESAARDLLTAVVLALAGAPWASPVRVLADPALAGRLPELDRVELLGDPGVHDEASDGVDPAARMRNLLAYATTTAAEVRRGGRDTLAAARAAGAGESTELVLLAGLPAAALTAELAAAALDPASPLLALSLGAHPRGVTWTLGAGGLEVPGLAEPLVPAGADPDRLADVASLLTEMAGAPDVPAEHPDYALLRADAPPQPADPRPEPAAEGGAVPANTSPPGRFEIAVLGPVELLGAPVPGRPVLLEICTYLALHRRGVTGEQLATALHPDGLLAAKTLRNRVGELRRLLAGAVSNGPRWRLAAEVTSDWQRFQALAAGDREQQRAALELVRGRPFDGLDAPEWLFRERYAAEVEAAVLDLAATAARDALHRGEPAAAALAAAAGLRANPNDERLRRLEMRAAAARGDLSRLRAVMSELKALVAADDDPEHAITEETRTLYGRLLREAQRRPADGPSDRRAASA
jgi:hypothetical protein